MRSQLVTILALDLIDYLLVAGLVLPRKATRLYERVFLRVLIGSLHVPV